jgi:hypothetical protein
LDSAGNASTLWAELTTSPQFFTSLFSANRGAAGVLGSPAALATPIDYIAAGVVQLPEIQELPSGNATAFWTVPTQVYTADRLAGQRWSTPVALIPNGYHAFAMNQSGDQALAWITLQNVYTMVNGISTLTDQTGTIYVIRRTAFGAWGAPQVVASGSGLRLDTISLNDNGELTAAWQSFAVTVVRGRSIVGKDFVLHAARPATSATQQDASAPWSTPTTLPIAAGTTAGLVGSSASNTGMMTATFVLGDGTVIALNGSMTANSWSAPVSVGT